VKELREVAMANPAYPPILFFYMGDVDEGEAFFQRFWPEARAVSDPEKQFYAAFGLERAGFKEMFNPELVACGLRAAKNGSYGGKPVGDPRMMPGAFLVVGSQILWEHNYRHIADHPEFHHITEKLAVVPAGGER
jgi:hypothetical protein